MHIRWFCLRLTLTHKYCTMKPHVCCQLWEGTHARLHPAPTPTIHHISSILYIVSLHGRFTSIMIPCVTAPHDNISIISYLCDIKTSNVFIYVISEYWIYYGWYSWRTKEKRRQITPVSYVPIATAAAIQLQCDNEAQFFVFWLLKLINFICSFNEV